MRRVAAIPGVTAAGLNSALPLEGGGAESPVIAEGQALPAPGQPGTMCLFQASSPDYLKAMSVPLLKGRFFTSHDVAGSAPVVIVDDALVRKLFGDDGAARQADRVRVRRQSRSSEPIWREIVGVVHHVRHYGLTSEPPFVQVYVPVDQLPLWFEQRQALDGRRGAHEPDARSGHRVDPPGDRGIDPDIPVYGVQTMRQTTSARRWSSRGLAWCCWSASAGWRSCWR